MSAFDTQTTKENGFRRQREPKIKLAKFKHEEYDICFVLFCFIWIYSVVLDASLK